MKVDVTLEVSTYCNYNCWYCFAHSAQVNELPKELIKPSLQKLPKHSEIQVIGGEPALYSELDYLIKCLEEHITADPDSQYYIQTNLSPKAYERIKDYDFPIAASYHPQAKFEDFLKFCIRLGSRICAIDVMFYGPETLETAKKFKKFFINTEVVLRPLTPIGAWDKPQIISKIHKLLQDYYELSKTDNFGIFEPQVETHKKLIQFNPDYKRVECPLKVIIDHKGDFRQCPIAADIPEKCRFCPLL